MTALIGQSLGRYQILERLGEGGMATVYKAYDTRLETEVALKIIRTENLAPSMLERSLKRFEREAKALARLTHPNIVKVMDYGEYEGKPYLVMEYLPGGTLKQKMGKPMPWGEAFRLLCPIFEALQYAHGQNMIHRDVKPANILLTQDGHPMLTDFGIAKILDLDETQDLTGTNTAIGTPEYMAPEQSTAKSVDLRADIYALGVVLYEMLTGHKPFVADTPMAVLIMHARDPLPSPRRYVPELPERVEKILLTALAKNPQDRYQSMVEFMAALDMAGWEKSFAGAPPAPVYTDTMTFEKEAGVSPVSEFRPRARVAALTSDTVTAKKPARRKWLPWAALVILLGLALIVGSGLVNPERQGAGLLDGPATEPPRLTSTSPVSPVGAPVTTFPSMPTESFTPVSASDIVGTWRYRIYDCTGLYLGQTIGTWVFQGDGTMISADDEYTWTWDGMQLRIYNTHGKLYMVVSVQGTGMTGGSNIGQCVTANKIR